MSLQQSQPLSAVELARTVGSWLSSTSLAERFVTLAVLFLPGAYLAVYCYQQQVPFPALGAGLGLFLGLILVFLLIAAVVIGYSFVAPAVISAVVFPQESGGEHLSLTKRTFAVWFGVPLALACASLWVISQSDGWRWLWALVPLSAVGTSQWASRRLAPGTVGAGKPWSLALLAFGLLICAAIAMITYIGPLGRGVKGWPDSLQWLALWASLGVYACLVYVLLYLPDAIRRKGRRHAAMSLAITLLGVAFLILARPSLSVPAVSQFLMLLQRGGGEPVEVIIATDVAAAEGLLTTPTSASLVRCRARLLLDFGDETSLRFAGQSHVSHMRASELRRVLRSPRPERRDAPTSKEPVPRSTAACIAAGMVAAPQSSAPPS